MLLVAAVAVAALIALAVLVVGDPTRSRTAAARSASGDGPGSGLLVVPTGVGAPAFRLPRLGGGPPVSLAAERGHPVVVNFFASWCTECRAELRAFAQVAARPGDVLFVGVDTNDGSPATARGLLEAAGVRYPVAVDRAGAVANGEYLIQALPATVFVYADGRVAGHVYGALSVGELESWMARLTSNAHGA
jgi:cytochrome c biogenesis protein CcmG/thiol:disulfide interchange protein DsbE